MSALLRRRWLWVSMAVVVFNVAALAVIDWRISRRQSQLEVVAVRLNSGNALEVAFSQNMVETAQVGTPVPDGWIALTPSSGLRVPAAEAYWSWSDARTARLTRASRESSGVPLNGSTKFQVVVAAEARSRDGVELGKASVNTFETPRLTVLAVKQAAFNQSRALLAVTFNQAVDLEQVRRHLKLIGGKDETLTSIVSYVNSSHRVIHVEYPPDGFFTPTVTIDAEMPSSEGPLPLGHSYSQVVTLNADLNLLSVDATNWNGIGLRLNFNQRINPAEANGFITVTPAVQFTVQSDWQGVMLRGAFLPETDYRVTVLAGFKSASGSYLATERTLSVHTPSLRPELGFAAPGVYLTSAGKLDLALRTVNVAQVQVTFERVFANNLLHFYRDFNYNGRPANNFGRPVVSTTLATTGTANETQISHLQLRDLLGDSPRGAYVVAARDTEKYSYRSAIQLVIITDLGITAKTTADEMLVWVNTLSTAQPVAGAQVQVMTAQNQVLASGRTDANGVLRIPLPAPATASGKARDTTADKAGPETGAAGATVTYMDAGPDEPYAVIVQQGDDLALLELERGTLDTSSFGVTGRPYLRRGYEAYVYCDRGAYRPGETVHAAAIVRTPDGVAPTAFPLRLELLDPQNRVVASRNVTPDGYGTVDATFDLQSAARSGRYTVRAVLPQAVADVAPLGTSTLQVESFMPDRLKVSIRDLDTIHLPPTAAAASGNATSANSGTVAPIPVPVNVEAAYLFGAPAAGLKAEASATLQALAFSHPAWAGWHFADAEATTTPLRLPLGKQTLDEAGHTTFTLTLPTNTGFGGSGRLEVQASVMEVGNRAVSTRATQTVDLHPAYIGLRQLGDRKTNFRVPMTYQIALVRPDGVVATPEATTTQPALQATLESESWNTVLEYQNGRTRFISKSVWGAVRTWPVALQDGRAELSFTLPGYGRYRLRVVDPLGGAASAVYFDSWGDGDHGRDLSHPDRIDLTFDRDDYAPGDTAKLVVRAPFAGRALVTVETDRILTSRVIEMNTNTTELEVPVTAECTPNAYVTVTVLRGVQPGSEWTSPRAFGVACLRLKPRHAALAVTVDGPAEARPGALWNARVHVGDAVMPAPGAAPSGHRARVVVALVDEGILSLTGFKTPSPTSWFGEQRGLVPLTRDLYSQVLPEPATAKPDGPAGVGGDYSEDAMAKRAAYLNPFTARVVENVALWCGTVETDDAGNASVAIPLPAAFSGALRCMVIAATPESTGTTETQVTVRGPLNVIPSLPRFLAPGDACEGVVTIHNLGHDAGPLTVKLVADGVHLDAPAERTLAALAPGKSVDIALPLSAPDVPGVASLTITATLGGESVTRRVEFTVRPPRAPSQEHGVGVVLAGKPVALTLPNGWLAGTKTASLHLSRSPAIRLGGSLEYLLHYPYGCVEQTSSSTLPLLYMKDLVMSTQANLATPAQIDAWVNAGVARLLSMQLTDGSFGYWPGAVDTCEWGSIYAIHTLTEAQHAGYAVPDDAMDRAQRWLGKLDRCDTATAYAQQVLALDGKATPARVMNLYNGRKNLDSTGRYMVAATLGMLRERQYALSLIDVKALAEPIDGIDGGSDFHTPIREQGMRLSTYLDVQPDSPHVPELADWLARRLENTAYWNTQGNAVALTALGKYLNRVKQQEQSATAAAAAGGATVADGFQARVRSGDTLLATFDGTHIPDQITLDPGTRELALDLSGAGQVFYWWEVGGVPLISPKEGDSGLHVNRRFLHPDGSPYTEMVFKQGDLVVVELDISSRVNAPNIAIVDLLPAGFEIETTSLASRADMPWLKGSAAEQAAGASDDDEDEDDDSGDSRRRRGLGRSVDYIDGRDDRMLVFASLGISQRDRIFYLVRAITPGRYVLPAVHASSMYDPTLSSLHGEGTMEVRREH